MKKIITTALLFALVFTLQANPIIPVNSKLKASLEKLFPGATQTNWNWLESKQLYQASFRFQEQQVNAYFTTDGEFVATSRYISKSLLPVAVTRQLMLEYPSHHMNTVIEYNNGSQLLYYVTLQGENNSLMVEATPTGNLYIFKKIKNKK